MPGTRLSVVIPALDEADGIVALLTDLRARFPAAELVVADGGSLDATATLAAPLADRIVPSPPGRARQANAGAAAATGTVLLFLHADTRLPDDAADAVAGALEDGGPGRDRWRGREWGRFDVRIAGAHPLLPTIAHAMNLRSRLSGVATGDQAMFAMRETFDAVGGYPDIALMEDVALSKRLRRRGSPACLRARAVTSGRRWDANGAARTILVMWALRLCFVLGVPPARLAAAYAALRRG